MSADSSLIRKTAVEVRDLLAKGEVTPLDLLDTLEARIAAVDPVVNALPVLCFERAREQARKLMEKPVGERGRLAGLPVPIKDLIDVSGVRTTKGSPIFADNVAAESDILVERLEGHGAVIYAKSNTPEFGAGANTFNEVFGATLNPWNTTKSAAGSSGGAAVALATGTAWLAQGSDTGGSLRNPASFCGVVGMRPSIGRVAKTPGPSLDATLGVQGPMARSVAGLALMLDAMAGDHPADPLSLPPPATPFTEALTSGWKPRRVAYSPDLGITPVDPEVVQITRAAAMRFAEASVEVVEAHPDLTEAHDCFQVLRAHAFATSYAGHMRAHPGHMKPEIVWNTEKGLALTVDDITRAERQRVDLARRTLAFFDDYDLLLCPSTIVAAFPIEERYLAACNGTTFETYVDWLAIAYAITLTCCPALSLPAGFTSDGLPIGLQVVAPSKREDRIIAGAQLLESILNLQPPVPIDPRTPA
jgi:amidase